MQKTIKKTAGKLPLSLLATKLRSKIRINNELANGFKFKIAQNKDEFEGACRLVHDQYVQKGYMERRKSGMRLSLFHALPETTTFIGKKNDLLAYTLTLFQDSALGLPMDSIYKKELDSLRAQGRKIAEVGALAAHPDIQKEDQTVLMHGNKIMHKYGRDHLGVDDLVIAINPKHQWLYEHVLLFEKIGDLTQYDYVKKAPAVAYRLNLRSAEAKYRAVYGGNPPEKNLHKFFMEEKSSCIEFPDGNAVLCFWDREKIRYFFEERTTLLYKADKKTREYLQRQYLYKIGLNYGFPGTFVFPQTNSDFRHPDDFSGVAARVHYSPAA
jgi:hypothetical protein